MAVTTHSLVAEWVGKLAKTGTLPGNNADPTGTWDDAMGSHDGTLSTFAYTTASGWKGAGSAGDPYALQFDGASDIVGCGGVGDFNVWTALTMEAWVYVPASNGASYPRIIDKNDNSGYGFALYLHGVNGTLGTKIMIGGTLYDGVPASATTNMQASPGWYHVAMTYVSTDGYLRFYVNGATEGNPWATVSGSINTSVVNLCLGNREVDSARPWYGAIATVRIYSDALSAAEVLANYNAGILAASTDAAAGFTGLTVTRLLNG
jgi:hypothetical protein